MESGGRHHRAASPGISTPHNLGIAPETVAGLVIDLLPQTHGREFVFALLAFTLVHRLDMAAKCCLYVIVSML